MIISIAVFLSLLILLLVVAYLIKQYQKRKTNRGIISRLINGVSADHARTIQTKEKDRSLSMAFQSQDVTKVDNELIPNPDHIPLDQESSIPKRLKYIKQIGEIPEINPLGKPIEEIGEPTLLEKTDEATSTSDVRLEPNRLVNVENGIKPVIETPLNTGRKEICGSDIDRSEHEGAEFSNCALENHGAQEQASTVESDITVILQTNTNNDNPSLLATNIGLDEIEEKTEAPFELDFIPLSEDNQLTIEKLDNPPKYIPPVRAPSKQPRSTSSVRKNEESSIHEEEKLSIAVRIHFDRSDSIHLTLLLGRRPGFPDLVKVAWSDQEFNIFSLTNNWFDGISLPEIGQFLEKGIEFGVKTDKEKMLKWSLSGRSIYILSSSNELSGFISSTRLVVNEEQVVLCKKELLQSVIDVIALTGSPSPKIYGSKDGLPDGWFCLRNILPLKPILQEGGQDILNILRPLPDMTIILKGGIRIDKSSWLKGYPPNIILQGDLSIVDHVLIDSHEAFPNKNGGYTTLDYDFTGDHVIWAGGQNKYYTIVEVSDGWDRWDGYSYEIDGGSKRAICGPLVTRSNKVSENLFPIVVPATHIVLIGAIPGQIYIFQPRPGEKRAAYGDLLSFRPIWALPYDPYHVDKLKVKILLLDKLEISSKIPDLVSLGQSERDALREWSTIILSASSKGLSIEPFNTLTEDLWNNYKQHAKAIRRKLRWM